MYSVYSIILQLNFLQNVWPIETSEVTDAAPIQNPVRDQRYKARILYNTKF